MSLYSRLDRLAADVEKLNRQVTAVANSPQSQRTSVEGGSIDFNDADGNLMAIMGGQDDGSNTIRHVDGPTPPVPSGLSAHVDGPIVQVSWDGTFESNVTHDWHYLEVLAVGPNNEQLTGTINDLSGGETSLAATAQGDWFITARSVSRAGKRSLDGDAGTVAVQLVGLTGAIDAVQESANGKNTIYYSATMPPGTDYVEGDLWFDTSEEGNNRASVWDGAEWLSVADGRVTDIAAAQGVLDANQEALDGRLDDAFGQIEDAIVSANGKNVVHYEDRRPTPSDPGVEGDTWFYGDIPQPVVESTNYSDNPSLETSGSKWSTYAWSGTGARTSGTGKFGNWFYRLTPSATQSGFRGRYADYAAPVNSGEDWTVSVFVRPSREVSMFARGEFRSGSTVVGSPFAGPVTVCPANVWTRLTVTATAAGSADRIRHQTYLGDATLYAGDTLDIDAELIARGGVQPYFDGSVAPVGFRSRWAGAVGSSVSEKYSVISDNWNVTEQYRYVNGAWENVELSHNVLSSMDVGKLVAGSAAIKEAVVQKLWAEVVVAKMLVAEEFIGENAILTGAVTADKMAAGSITAESGIIESLDLGTATVGELDGARIMGQTIHGAQLSGDAIDGKVITGGTYRTSGGNGSWSDAGLFIAQPDGTSMVRFPTDGSPLSLTASDVQIDRASITDLDLSYGAVRSGGEFTLASGVTAPASPPELTTGWQKVCTLDTPDRKLTYDWLGLGYWAEGSGHWVRAVNVLGSEGDGYDRIEVYDYATGDFQKSISITLNPRAGVTVIGDVAYVLGPNYEEDSFSPQYVDGYDLNTGVKVSYWGFTRFATNAGGRLAIGNDGTNVVVAGITKSNNLYVMRYDPTTGAQVGGEPNPPSDPLGGDWMATGWTGGRDLLGVHISGSEVIIHPLQETRVYTASGNTLTRKTDSANANGYAGWVNPNRNGAGMVFVGGVPYVVDSGDLYEGSAAASGYTRELCFTWYDGTHETNASPVAVVDVAAREEVTVSLPVRAGLQKRLYARTQGVTNWERATVAADATVVPMPVGLSLYTPPTTNTFPSDVPAVLKSATGNFEVNGNGGGKWGPLTFNTDGSMSGIPKMAAGRGVSVVVPTGSDFNTKTVYFPPGRFASPPSVTISVDATSTAVVNYGVLNVTKDDFTVSVRRTNNTPTNVAWIAMEADI